MLRKIAPILLLLLCAFFIFFPVFFLANIIVGSGSYANAIPHYNNVDYTVLTSYNYRTSQPNQPVAKVFETFATTDSLEQVRDFYLDRFKREGWREFKNPGIWTLNTELALYYEKGATLVIVSGSRIGTDTSVIVTYNDD